MKLLQIKSSILGQNSNSSKYTDKLINNLKKDGDEVMVRDVAVNTVTQLSAEVLGQLGNSESLVSKEHGSLIEEIKSSNVVIIAAPMYNFSIPATLKNYFDAITKVGQTFKYSEAGQPIGFLTGKKVYVIITRGGKYKEQGLTFQEDYLKMQLGFIGMTEVKFIFLEGFAMGVSSEEIENSFEMQIK
jgi:FMN-dependent NADH-azoreductase